MRVDLLPPRILAKIDRSGDCWVWTKSVDRYGYGKCWWDGRVLGAHRVVFALLDPSGYTGLLDHKCCEASECSGGVTCPHRRCVNPDHLRPMTHKQNVQIGHCHERELTHCERGHLFVEANTYIWAKTGERKCRTCGRDRKRAERAGRR